jgi:hypothetical protein
LDLAYGYVNLLLILEALLMGALLVEHISDIGFPIGLHADHRGILFGASVMVSLAAAAFIKDGLSGRTKSRAVQSGCGRRPSR